MSARPFSDPAIAGDLPDRLAHSPAEAAQLLGVSRSTIYALLQNGKLRSIQLGGRRLVPRSALLELLEVGR